MMILLLLYNKQYDLLQLLVKTLSLGSQFHECLFI